MEIFLRHEGWDSGRRAGERRGEFQIVLRCNASGRGHPTALVGQECPTHSDTRSSPEAGAFEGLAEVGTFHFHDAAHFVETGAHALSDAVAEGLSSRGPLRTGKV